MFFVPEGNTFKSRWSFRPAENELKNAPTLKASHSFMAQTLVKVYIHVVFSTKNRDDLILPEIEKEMFAYIGGILRKHQSALIAANGTENHVHLLISQSKNFSLSDLLRELKKASSLWIKTKNVKFARIQ